MSKEKHLVHIQVDYVSITGSLEIPDNAQGLIVFAHGSGSGRFSPRNNYVAKVLQKSGFGTLLIDLLTEDEDRIYENRFNIDLLKDRLISVIKWLKAQPQARNLSIGLFGASTGAAAALKAAATPNLKIEAIVSRGGRPDLAEESLNQIKSPTLLIVGRNDVIVIELNKKAYQKLKSIKKLEVVEGATHLFEEPGKLEKVTQLATAWFRKYLTVNERENLFLT